MSSEADIIDRSAPASSMDWPNKVILEFMADRHVMYLTYTLDNANFQDLEKVHRLE